MHKIAWPDRHIETYPSKAMVALVLVQAGYHCRERYADGCEDWENDAGAWAFVEREND